MLGHVCSLPFHRSASPESVPALGKRFPISTPTLVSGFTSWLRNRQLWPEARTPACSPGEPVQGLSDCFSRPHVVTHSPQGQPGLFAFPDTDLVGKDCREKSGPGPGTPEGCYHRANRSLLAGWIPVNREINRLKANGRNPCHGSKVKALCCLCLGLVSHLSNN